MFVGNDEHNTRVLSWQAIRGQVYTCPECRGKLILKRGWTVEPHFAHYRRPETCSVAKESALHHEMKLNVFRALQGIWPDSVQLEYGRGCGRADVWVRPTSGRAIAIECQVTRLDSNKLYAKLWNYRNVGDTVLMIAPKKCIRSWEPGIVQVDTWLRQLHALAFGRVYVYHQTNVYPVHLENDCYRSTLRSPKADKAVQWKLLTGKLAGTKGVFQLPGLNMAHFEEGAFWK